MNIFTLKILLLVLMIFTIACNDTPTENIKGERFGKVFITSNVIGAEIFLDNISMNKLTPDTISALATGHIIKIRNVGFFSAEQEIIFDDKKLQTLELILIKNKLKKNVLLENFTNVNCGKCIEASITINKLQNQFSNSLFFINYHTQFPSSNDPFYNEAKTDINLRANYYGVFESPTIIIYGAKSDLVNDISILFTTIEKSKKEFTSFEISVQDSVLSQNGFNIAVFVDVFDADNLNFKSLVLRILLIEKNIELQKSPGTNGERKFSNVVRAILPSNNGRSLEGINQKGKYKFFENKLLNPLWKTDNLFVVAFIQNNLTKKILQAGSSE
ncbi:MAG: hypothetical protein V3V16_01590 [Melioribacteraceae bacterium]